MYYESLSLYEYIKNLNFNWKSVCLFITSDTPTDILTPNIWPDGYIWAIFVKKSTFFIYNYRTSEILSYFLFCFFLFKDGKLKLILLSLMFYGIINSFQFKEKSHYIGELTKELDWWRIEQTGVYAKKQKQKQT